ncbi:FKBP-type peptidyl-prolyl cis-trans isomerase [Rudanella lutea]|uniref:FKBP-type peptidyl-prolyl cis-trans isomerase n=1 Tax=Rudanella lutea TaxID=451374 RepID=UPI000363FCBD|nr:FKBP-type peptidyl-prolyl cis-trans isomerase [Rudanella lutea]
MTFFKVFLAGAASAALLSGSALAQAKKTAPKPTPAKSSARPAAPAAPGMSLRTTNDSLSYSIGLNIAQNMKQQGITDINSAMLARGINDALKGGNMAMTPEQANMVLGAFMQKQMAVRQAESAKAAEGNKKIGNAFLAENKTKPGVVTTTSGLQYKVVKEGTGSKPTPTDRVKVHYTGRLIDGKVFDSSEQRGQPAEFGVTEVIRGWTEVLQLMPVGSRWTVYIPSDLAYGDRGAGADIGPGSTLIFDVELLDIVK